MEPVSGMEFVIMLAFGRPSEEAQRKSVAEFKRKPLSEISDIKGMDELMEAVRLAPSGINNQSWYYHGEGDRIDAFHAKSMLTEQMNQTNVGIGLCCLWLSALHFQKTCEFVYEKTAEGKAPKGYRYVMSAQLK